MRKIYCVIIIGILLCNIAISRAYDPSFNIQWKHFSFLQLESSAQDQSSITNDYTFWNASEISWSPEGNQIVIGIENRDISIFDLRTEKLNTLTVLPEISKYLLPEWSPDGKLIAVAASQG